MDRNSITHKTLKSLGFRKRINPWRNKELWRWGSYTTQNPVDGGLMYEPILEWDEESREMTVNPAQYKKTINTVGGIEKMMDLASYLISTES